MVKKLLDIFPENDWNRWIRDSKTKKLNLSNCATKFDLKGATDSDAAKFAKRADLASVNSEVDRLDMDKLDTTTVDLSKLSKLVKHDFVKKNYLMN